MAADLNPIAVFGNVTLDVICQTVDDVPRHGPLLFDQAAVTPGGCASNTAIGLAALGAEVLLIACAGDDLASDLLFQDWAARGVDASLVTRIPGSGPGVSVGLVDSQLQPRFVHTSGANGKLTADHLDVSQLIKRHVKFLYTAGYFVLPGLLDSQFADRLAAVQEAGIFTALDVVTSPRMDTPAPLWGCLPHLDVFLCNAHEAELITGLRKPETAGQFLLDRGAGAVIVKLGPDGCLLVTPEGIKTLPGIRVDHPVDTTGAGDAFAAGLMFGLASSGDLETACQEGMKAGAAVVGFLGAVPPLPGGGADD